MVKRLDNGRGTLLNGPSYGTVKPGSVEIP